ncbi:hypothetical protein EDB92DRAFT_1956025 [Lactarius akahatsu]|uniref:F-box domain-containing protein n=1 Tax=Lactarius akahatsu TaxID=416441 RepID=A0AAD4Q818_9AGAM|nr:hypothetical protein EDB92DRAFT_1956025 [Lactarius akahatsu]
MAREKARQNTGSERWRAIVFASSRHLDLRLLCKRGTPVRHALDYWLPLPIIIDYREDGCVSQTPQDGDDIVAALSRHDRMSRVQILAAASLLEKLSTPETVPPLPGKFLGGSAPRLQSLTLSGFPLPALPSVLPSATDLVSLRLFHIPDTSCVKPDVMVTWLSALTRLEWLVISFSLATLSGERRGPPPLTRVVLPALTRLNFRGDGEYLNDFVSQIDTPLLDHLGATFFNWYGGLELPHLSDFILRTGGGNPSEATIHSIGSTVFVTLYQLGAEAAIFADNFGWASRVGSLLLARLAERLYIDADYVWHGHTMEGNENSPDLWLNVLLPFKSVVNLYVSDSVAPGLAKGAWLKMWPYVSVEELLPALRMIRFETPRKKTSVKQFLAVDFAFVHNIAMVERWPQLSPRDIVTAVNVPVRILSGAGRTSRDEVMRKLGRTVTLFRRSRNRRNGGEIEQHAKIDTLPDEILLEIFDCFRLAAATVSSAGPTWSPWEWHRFVHVCRRWRFLVFASSHRLDLRLVYTFKRPARVRKKALDGWPTLPIAIWYPRPSVVRGRSEYLEDVNNTSFALRHPDRIREINLFLTKTLMSKSSALFLTSFPALEYLRLESENTMKASTAVLPLGFLGSTPRLRDIHLKQVPFSALPLLLLSTRNLVSLRLDDISSRGYFTPEALSISLSVTTQLKSLCIHFLPFVSSVFRDPGSAGCPLRAYAVLPALSEFHFRGDSAYLEDLISRIDAPVMESLNITFFKPSAFDTLQLSQFISRTKSLASLPRMSILLLGDEILVVDQFQLSQSTPSASHFQLQITCDELDLQVTLPNILARLSGLLSGVQQLDMKSFLPWSAWLDPDEMDSALWLDFFRNLKSVTRLEVAGMFVPSIESALEQLPEEMVRRVLPALHDFHVGKCQSPGPFEKFADARQLSDRPLTIHYAASLSPLNTLPNESHNDLSVVSLGVVG